MGRILVEVDLANNQDVQLHRAKAIPADEVRRLKLPAYIDTGANYLVLPTAAADFLGLLRVGDATVRYADRRTAQRQMVEQVEVELLGRRSTFRALLEPDRETALIGAIVLEDLDLIVDCGKQRIFPRDPHHVIAELE